MAKERASFYDTALGRVIAEQVRAISFCVIAGDVDGLRAFTDNPMSDEDFRRYLASYTGGMAPSLRPWRPGLFPDHGPTPSRDGRVYFLFEPIPFDDADILGDSSIRMTLQADPDGKVTFLNLAY